MIKCSHCGKEINEVYEKYVILTYDGDFIHEKCMEEHNEYEMLEDNYIANLIEKLDVEDDGTRHTLEEVLELARSLIDGAGLADEKMGIVDEYIEDKYKE